MNEKNEKEILIVVYDNPHYPWEDISPKLKENLSKRAHVVVGHQNVAPKDHPRVKGIISAPKPLDLANSFRDFTARCQNIQFISCVSVGFEHLGDVQCVKERKVRVSAGDLTAPAVAALAFYAIIGTSYNISAAEAAATQGKMPRGNEIGKSILNETVGIVGYGNIGSCLARLTTQSTKTLFYNRTGRSPNGEDKAEPISSVSLYPVDKGRGEKNDTLRNFMRDILGDLGYDDSQVCTLVNRNGIWYPKNRNGSIEGSPALSLTQKKLIEHMALKELFQRSGIIVNCLPETPDTEGFFNDEEFNMMKQGSIFVNVGRGKTVNTDALIRALRSRKVAKAYLDVTHPEPLPPNHPLLTEFPGRVRVSGHVGGRQKDTVADLSADAVKNAIAALNGEDMPNEIDLRTGKAKFAAQLKRVPKLFAEGLKQRYGDGYESKLVALIKFNSAFQEMVKIGGNEEGRRHLKRTQSVPNLGEVRNVTTLSFSSIPASIMSESEGGGIITQNLQSGSSDDNSLISDNVKEPDEEICPSPGTSAAAVNPSNSLLRSNGERKRNLSRCPTISSPQGVKLSYYDSNNAPCEMEAGGTVAGRILFFENKVSIGSKVSFQKTSFENAFSNHSTQKLRKLHGQNVEFRLNESGLYEIRSVNKEKANNPQQSIRSTNRR